ncbi:MAG: hypothetical protein II567_15765 [Candidatus Riflebacteria bacterium]|nr:hypothetical protein [Candidatus Riflebacteria bacterium]
MKNLRYVLMALVLVSVFCFQATKASALEAKFEFYYQSIEEVKTINEPIKEDDSLWTKFKKTVKKGTNAVKRLWEKGVTRNIAPGEGEKTWYSEGDKNIAYTVKRTKVTSEAELLSAMGVKSESELNDGQKALLAVFRKSKSQAIADEAKIGYIPTVKVLLSDTTGFDDKSKYPNVTKDFWPYSSGLAINMSSNNYNYPGGDKDAESTLVHEYAHCLDATFKEFKNPYGLDGSHYGNEITGKRAAFVEAWAEYNEMIASEDEAKAILKKSESLCEESKTVAGSYTWNIKQEDCTADQLMRSEAHLAKLLYRLTMETDNGKEKVYKAFTSTRLNVFRDMSTLVKKFIKQNPGDTEVVCKIVDEVFLGKMTDEEFLDYVGKNDVTKAYVENRGKNTEDENAELELDSSTTEVTTSNEKINVENSSGNPFSDD